MIRKQRTLSQHQSISNRTHRRYQSQLENILNDTKSKANGFGRSHQYGFPDRLSHRYQNTNQSKNKPRYSMGQPIQQDLFDEIYQITQENIEMRRKLNDELKKNNDLLRSCKKIQAENQLLIKQHQHLLNRNQLILENQLLKTTIQKINNHIPYSIINKFENLLNENQNMKKQIKIYQSQIYR